MKVTKELESPFNMIMSTYSQFIFYIIMFDMVALINVIERVHSVSTPGEIIIIIHIEFVWSIKTNSMNKYK